jgi:hypothetical protein
MKIVFISGPLTTGGDGSRGYKANNIKTAEKYSVVLANSSIGFFCAHSHTSFHHEKGSTAPEKFYYDLDFKFLKQIADAVLAIPGWQQSYGAKKEVEWAQKKGLPVFFPKDSTDIKDIIMWAKS